jgi:hypothetical protein
VFFNGVAHCNRCVVTRCDYRPLARVDDTSVIATDANFDIVGGWIIRSAVIFRLTTCEPFYNCKYAANDCDQPAATAPRIIALSISHVEKVAPNLKKCIH